MTVEMARSRTTDPILLEVLRNRFKAIAEEMAAATLRTAHTVFVKETQDFGACLVSAKGEVFAAPTDTAVSVMAGLPAWEIVNALGKLRPGDVGISNDPTRTRGLSTHLPDIWLWKPIFASGEIIAFGLSFIHSSDVGGKVAGSISPTSYDVFQEGFRIPPLFLCREGVINQDVIDMVLVNSRIPDQNWGDIKAQIASLNVAERRLLEIVSRYGESAVRDGIEDVMVSAEERARHLIEAIPDGRYSFVDYMEGDDAGVGLIRIKLTMEVRGSDLVMDFTGTDQQVRAALNLPSWNQRGHRQICFALLNLFRSLDPDIPYNSGLVRPVELRIPRGTLLNPEPGAATGVRAATMFRVLDNVFGCLTQAIPEIVPAAGSGAVAIVLLSIMDPVTGKRRVEVAQPLNGGSGARPRQDGVDGTSFTGGWLRNIPNEVLEADMPVLVEEYGYREDSSGPGRHRGGVGIRFRLRSLAPEMLLTARGLERFTFQPWGLRGGEPGEVGSVLLDPGGPEERPLGKLDAQWLQDGQRIQFETAGGGGFGDPFQRPAEDVVRDVETGIMTPEDARARYGVVVASGALDADATRQLRAARRPRQALFDVGSRRRAYEHVLNERVADRMVELIEELPRALRPLVGTRMRAEIERREEPPTDAELRECLCRVCGSLGLAIAEGAAR